jgi:hypothetical protein
MADTKAKSVTPTKYRFVGNHAHEIFKADGTCPWVAPGDYIDMTDEDLAAAGNEELSGNLIDATGVVLETENAPQPEVEPANTTSTVGEEVKT